MQKVFKSTEGLIAMDYAPIYREKHIKGMLDRRIMGDGEIVEEAVEPKPETKVVVEEQPVAKYNRV